MIKKISRYSLFLAIFALFSGFVEAKNIDIQIIFTSDEHGWILKEGKDGGSAELFDQWLKKDSIDSRNTLIVSGGDNFTGPAISTYTKGAAALEVMNSMRYNYSILGNHEFDFGLDRLSEILKNSKFRYLAANLEFDKNIFPVNCVEPYASFNQNGVNVFILGLANNETPGLTSEKNIKGIRFVDYQKTLEKYKDQIKTADIAILLTHLCFEELEKLAPKAKALGFDLLCGGHCHRGIDKVYEDMPIVEGESYNRSYSNIKFRFDDTKKELRYLSFERSANLRDSKYEAISSIIDKWRDSTDIVLKAPIGYAESEIPAKSHELYNLILDSWLKAYPEAQVAFTNRGSIRQGIPKGDISLSTLMGIMPFDNELSIVEMSGKDLKFNIDSLKPVVAGINVKKGYKLSNGKTLQDDEKYLVIVNSFIYNNGDKYQIKNRSKLIKNTGVNMRVPLYDLIKKHKTSWNRALNTFLDSEKRVDDTNH
jgi:2',3'-cyclic-nucleotide 2'-phosphodiesterase (5'-nucleotidase family)